MTLHLIALPHTRVTPEFCGCAYTAKNLKFTKMMTGHDVVLYAPEGSTTEHTAETVEVISDKDRRRIFGPDDPARLPAWPTDEQTDLFNRRAARALTQRYAPGDIVLLSAGLTHAPIMSKVPQALYCEPGVGYEGIATDFCAFESHAWRHHVYAKRGINDGRWFDTVIPNYFDADDFPYPDGGDDGYLLFLGRLIPRKGPHVAAQVAAAAGLPLIVAGGGDVDASDGLVCAGRGTSEEVRMEGDVTYVGPVGVAERGDLLSRARALIVPTTYVEPFGGVAVEAMMCGTPAITTDFGAFTETVQPGVTGYRFRTLSEGIRAVEDAESLDRARIREVTMERYSLAAVEPLFDTWFGLLDTIRGEGWYDTSRAKVAA